MARCGSCGREREKWQDCYCEDCHTRKMFMLNGVCFRCTVIQSGGERCAGYCDPNVKVCDHHRRVREANDRSAFDEAVEEEARRLGAPPKNPTNHDGPSFWNLDQ